MKIIYSEKILDRLSIFMKIGGITLYPWIILRERYRDNSYYFDKAKIIINHESIHIKQQVEMGIVIFFIWYVLEWFIRIFTTGGFHSAYKAISFEQEANANENNPDYLKTRKFWSWIKYL